MFAIILFAALAIGSCFLLLARYFRASLAKAEALAEELKERVNQQEVVYDITQSFASGDNPSVLIRNALAIMVLSAKAARGFLFVLENDSKTFRLDYEFNNPGQLVPFYSQASLIFHCEELLRDAFVIKGELSLHFNSLKDDDSASSVLSRLGCKACVFVPVHVYREVWGVLAIDHHADLDYWKETNVNMLKQLASSSGSLLERVQNEKVMVNARKEAEFSNAEKSGFLSSMSHEIRTPLNAIIGMAAIAKKAKSREAALESINKISEASEHLLGVINSILDLSKLEAGKMHMINAEFDFNGMIKSIVNMCECAMSGKQQNFTLNIERHMPSRIVCDEQRLSQVLINLLSNAVKFTPEKGDISLSVRVMDNAGKLYTVRFCVSDTGIGLSEEEKKRIFTPFAQASEGTSRKFGGTGLGLSISKSIIEAMGGVIWVDSELGRGASFTFELILEQGLSGLLQEQDSISADADLGSLENIFKGSQILIAEDIEINREIVNALLEETGIGMDFAEDGEKALELFTANQEKYSVILMDVHMPNMDGYEATMKIRRLDGWGKDVPIVAMTANVFQEDVEKCIASGMNFHLCKPVELDKLIEQLKMFLIK
ncbi:MAG: ATP-binding protein [Spirochaetes bacterium]|nr:ATP-binding protein [Spirochaetota bacterium]